MNMAQYIALAVVLLGAILGNAFFQASRKAPVETRAVRESCSACHLPDDHGRLSRIAFQRKSPEGWQETVRRMVRLHGLSISVEDAKAVIKYLSDQQGLAPAEEEPIAYSLERRDIAERVPDASVRLACVRCHSFARIAAQRRTPEEWSKLKDFHLAVFPTLVYQTRHVDWPAVAGQALKYLSEHYPFDTPEWRNWRPHPEIEGRWAIAGHQPGQGDFFGKMEITRGPAGQYRTQEELVFAGGHRIEKTGKGLLYTGFSWRGSSESSAGQSFKEVMRLSEDGEAFKGRWFAAESDQIGADVTLYREQGQPCLLGLSPRVFRAPASSLRISTYGVNLPSSLNAGDVDFGQGIVVRRLVNHTAEEITLEVEVEPGAAAGLRVLRIGNTECKTKLAVYDRIDYVKILPELGLARIGGNKVPKQHQQFEAIAFHTGPDNVPGTADDMTLGPVSAAWSLLEDTARPDDDDVKFVGSIDRNGLFTPAEDGPNPARHKGNNNVGQVWVVAEVSDGAKTLSARVRLIVTVPRFIESEIR